MYEHLDDADVGHDYLELLRRGSVLRRLALAEHAAWRLAIRKRAHADELKVRTWSRAGSPATVWAVLPDWSLTNAEHARLAQMREWQRQD
jgi:hypothetical protein